MKNQSESGDRGRRDTPVLNRQSDHELQQVECIGEFEKGDLVAGRFKILSLLGTGGMGFVYLVNDNRSGKNYAMKTVSAMNTSERIVQRFEREVQATSLIKHANVVQFHDFGLIDGVHPYFVMDYCEGDTLADLIKSEGSLPIERVLDIFIPICGAVAYAHTQSVVHRDLKPSNIMVKSLPGGGVQVKILDFGIAKILLDETTFNALTKTGELFGSPYYMSPEQCIGKTIDARSDIYSLGCVMFEALTGSPPFLSENPLTTMMKHQTVPPPTLMEGTLGREFPADLERIIAAMLAKNVDDRYDNLLLVEHDLRLLKRGERLADSAPEGQSSSRRFPFEIFGIGLCSLVLASVATYFMVRSSPEKPPQPAIASKPTPTAAFKSLDLPDLADMAKSKNSIVSTFYSTPITGDSSRRLFHFPAQSIGTVGYGNNEEKYIPAAGDMVLSVPFALVVGQDVGVLSGFHPDEVDNLTMRGPMVDDIATKLFRNWRQINNLNLDWTDVGDRSIENIQTLPKLRELHVSQTHISASGLSQLKLERLHTLEANQIAYLAPIIPRAKTGQLEVLKLNNSGLKNSDLKYLAQVPSLVVLDISGNEITDEGIESLIPIVHLNQLWFAGNNVTAKCMQSLSKMHHLKGVTLSMTNWTPTEKLDFLSAARKMHCSVSASSKKSTLKINKP